MVAVRKTPRWVSSPLHSYRYHGGLIKDLLIFYKANIIDSVATIDNRMVIRIKSGNSLIAEKLYYTGLKYPVKHDTIITRLELNPSDWASIYNKIIYTQRHENVPCFSTYVEFLHNWYKNILDSVL